MRKWLLNYLRGFASLTWFHEPEYEIDTRTPAEALADDWHTIAADMWVAKVKIDAEIAAGEPLGPDFERVWDEHAEQLYER